MGEKVFLAHCTLPEVEAHLRASPKIVVPVGATEQHGPHPPFGTDAILSTEASVRLARRIGALVAPALAYGVSGEHRGYAGVPFLSASGFAYGVTRGIKCLCVCGLLSATREPMTPNSVRASSIVELTNGTTTFSFDQHDDGLANGSQGVKFVSSPDASAPGLDNVAYAFTPLVTGSLQATYTHNSPTGNGNNASSPSQSTFTGGANLSWAMLRWLSLNGNYTYLLRSNPSTGSLSGSSTISVNTATLTLQAVF